MPKANLIVRSILVAYPQEAPTLFVEVQIDCDACGEYRSIISGHHLRTLHKALGMIIEAQGQYCGEGGEVASTTNFQGAHAPGSEQNN